MAGIDPSFEGTRKIYDMGSLDEADVSLDPLIQLRVWLDEAVAAKVLEPTALTVSTLDSSGAPRSRSVLMRHLDHGLVFFTNLTSDKARELAGEPRAAAQFLWLELNRQVRIEGLVERVADSESDAYFATRPRESQLGAWASPQSQVIAGRDALEELVAQTEARFASSDIVERPPFWGGLRLVPAAVEFWQGRRHRLHDRIAYRRDDAGEWTSRRLAP